MAKVLVTGGAGYIGSHTCIELAAAGHDIIVLDNFANSSPDVLERVEKLSDASIPIVQANVLETETVRAALRDHGCEAVIHFAGLKAVGESVERPLFYYRENVAGAVSLLEAMADEGVKKIIFSSSATVYGTPQYLPLTEAHPLSAINPYGQTKLMIEDILRDLYVSDPSWNICMLRYFNPCGAHQSGLIGENPKGRPNNLMPYIAQVAAGQRTHLNVMGNDYDTPDGTGVRDYIHVVDLARGHVAALKGLFSKNECLAINLGTGRGYSVLAMVEAFSKTCGKQLPYTIVDRRAGDVAVSYAANALAFNKLGWKAQYGIDRMCEDHWRWQKTNFNKGNS